MAHEPHLAHWERSQREHAIAAHEDKFTAASMEVQRLRKVVRLIRQARLQQYRVVGTYEERPPFGKLKMTTMWRHIIRKHDQQPGIKRTSLNAYQADRRKLKTLDNYLNDHVGELRSALSRKFFHLRALNRLAPDRYQPNIRTVARLKPNKTPRT